MSYKIKYLPMPINGKVLIKTMDAEEKLGTTESGLYIPESKDAVERSHSWAGYVVIMADDAFGTFYQDRYGCNPDIKIGDKVYFHPSSQYIVPGTCNKYMLIPDDRIFAVERQIPELEYKDEEGK